jgi:hypothetical protein
MARFGNRLFGLIHHQATKDTKDTKERRDEGKTRPQVEPAGWAGVGN